MNFWPGGPSGSESRTSSAAAELGGVGVGSTCARTGKRSPACRPIGKVDQLGRSDAQTRPTHPAAGENPYPKNRGNLLLDRNRAQSVVVALGLGLKNRARRPVRAFPRRRRSVSLGRGYHP